MMCDSCSFTSARSQILILSSACFALPGMFNALNSLSPPGLSNEHLKANANSLLYALFTISGLIAGGLQNKYGPRPLLCVGGATYVLVAGSYVAISKFGDDAAAFALTASSLLGVGAGLLWAAQGAMILSYPIESKKGSYFGIFWSIFNLGAVIGSIAAMIINWNSTTVGPNEGTYYAFMTVMIAGVFLAGFILSPHRVIKEDGNFILQHILQTDGKSSNSSFVWTETKAIARLFIDPRMILMLVPAASSNFFYTYQFDPFQGAFTTRTQGLNATFYWLAQMLSSWLLGSYILDDSRYKRTRRAWIGCAILSFSTMIVWGGGVFWEVKRQVSDNSISNSLDVLETTVQWAPGFLLYLAYGFYDAIFQTYAYWIMGALTNDAYRLSRYAGFYKSIQSAFGAVSWQLSNILYFRTNTLAWLLVTAAPCALSCFLFALIIWLYVEDTCEREDSIEPNQKNY